MAYNWRVRQSAKSCKPVMTGIKTIYKSLSTVKITWSWGYSSVGSTYLAPQLHSKFKDSLGYVTLVSNQ